MPRRERLTKKDEILALHARGMTDIDKLAEATESRPSYVASVLQQSGLMSGYFDLYTHTTQPMNVYSKEFEGKHIGFRDVATAEASVRALEEGYGKYREAKDRAGQHHALLLALTMLDRARWCGKTEEAAVFRRWLVAKLRDDDDDEDRPRH